MRGGGGGGGGVVETCRKEENGAEGVARIWGKSPLQPKGDTVLLFFVVGMSPRIQTSTLPLLGGMFRWIARIAYSDVRNAVLIPRI